MTNHICPPGVRARFELAIETAPTAYGLIAGPQHRDPNTEEENESDVFQGPEYEDFGVLDNGEYAGPIFFCPWCGIALPEQPA